MMVSKVNEPKMAQQFRLVKYCDLPVFMMSFSVLFRKGCSLQSLDQMVRVVSGDVTCRDATRVSQGGMEDQFMKMVGGLDHFLFSHIFRLIILID